METRTGHLQFYSVFNLPEKNYVFKCIAYIKKLKVTGNINYPNINKLEMFSVRNIFVARNPKLKPWLIAMSFFPNIDGRKRVFKLEIF